MNKKLKQIIFDNSILKTIDRIKMPIGKVRVGKYDYKFKLQPSTDDYTNILIHTTGQLSPYTMKDSDGCIMENYWQFSKCWSQVTAQKQPISRYNTKTIRWEHSEEKHVEDGYQELMNNHETPILRPEYWSWRNKGMQHDRWVRYPTGYAHHSEALGSIIGNPDEYEMVDYLTARRRIYFPKYKEIAEQTKLFKELKNRLLEGENLQINEVDGPTYHRKTYPYNLVENRSIEINEEILNALIDNPNQAFGHGYCLAAILLDIDLSN